MEKMIFKGSAVAIVTPMDSLGMVDYEALRHMLAFQLEHGTDAIVVMGTTGESAVMETKEKLQVIEYVIKYIDKRLPVIAGTGSNCTAHALSLSKEVKKLGADALLQVTPYYNKTSQNGLIRHFETIADQVELPMILYNVPSRTGVNISPDTCLALSKHPNIRGIKEASGNISQIAKIASLCGENFDIYSGNDDQTLPILSLGGKGVISVLANVMPLECHQMCQLFFEGDVKESRRIQLKLLDLMEALFWDINPIPVKAALSFMGMCEENLRLPLIPMEPDMRDRLFKILKRHLKG